MCERPLQDTASCAPSNLALPGNRAPFACLKDAAVLWHRTPGTAGGWRSPVSPHLVGSFAGRRRGSAPGLAHAASVCCASGWLLHPAQGNAVLAPLQLPPMKEPLGLFFGVVFDLLLTRQGKDMRTGRTRPVGGWGAPARGPGCTLSFLLSFLCIGRTELQD